MKIVSWNVNGIRAWVQKPGAVTFIEKDEKPDIFCIQETKAHKSQVDEFFEKEDTPLFESANDNGNIKEGKLFPDYPYHIWNSAKKKGYSGTAIFSKIEPISETFGLGTLKKEEQDEEGRVITLEFKDFFLVTVYTPNSKHGLLRLGYRYDTWDKAMLKHLKNLEKKKPVVLCGDMNVAHEEIDLANPKENRTTKSNPGNPGFTDQERERFSDFIEAGFIDTFRYMHPEEVKYSWWSYRAMARARNVGWRIDYFLVSKVLGGKIKKAEIFDLIEGSDHCPIGLELNL
ncbi:exodeoxyribonuclease III [Patescibacteria group bacterium]